MARWRPRTLAAACPLIVAELTFNLQCPLFQNIGLHAEALQTWTDGCIWSPVDPKQTSFGRKKLDHPNPLEVN